MIESGGEVDRALTAAVADRAFPGAVVLARRGADVAALAVGSTSYDAAAPPVGPETFFDLSSLTKPLATTTAIMLLAADGALAVDDRVARYLPSFAVCGKQDLRLRDLLDHSSGLAAWRPYFEEMREAEKRDPGTRLVGTAAGKRFAYSAVCAEQLEAAPGTREKYSDLGFIALGAVVEGLVGQTLDAFCRQRIFAPLGLDSLAFGGEIPPGVQVAPTEACPWRGRELCGEVHDDNAWAMGGIAGHAGLFGSVHGVDRVAQSLLAAWRDDDGLVPRHVVRQFWAVADDPGSSDAPAARWGLGWDTPAPAGSLAGGLFSRRTVGHLGFTGTSLWVDLERDCAVVLLTNRVHPSRDNDKIRELRPRLHDLVNKELGGLG